MQAIKFNLMAPNFPGDVMMMAGEVAAIEAGPAGGQCAGGFHGQ